MATTLPERLRPRPAEDVVSAALARWGFYGLNGAGKSTLLASVKVPGIVVSADTENVKPYRGNKHIQVVKVEEWEDLDDVLAVVRNMATVAQKNGVTPFVGFDTWTRMQGLVLNFLAGYPMVEPGKEADYMTRIPKLGGQRGQDSRNLYQQAGALLSEWMSYFNRLPVHALFLFQEMTRRPEYDNDIIETSPALTPSALARAMDSLELVGRLYVETSQGDGLVEDSREIRTDATEVRRLLIGKHPRYRTKGPTHVLGYTLENPTWDSLRPALQ